jgi:hypothetical protein
VLVADPGSGAFLTPGSGIGDGEKIWIRDQQPGPYFLELRNFNSLMQIWDPGWKKFKSGIRDGKNSDQGSGINIPIRNTGQQFFIYYQKYIIFLPLTFKELGFNTWKETEKGAKKEEKERNWQWRREALLAEKRTEKRPRKETEDSFERKRKKKRRRIESDSPVNEERGNDRVKGTALDNL